jgi:hypothetical protein
MNQALYAHMNNKRKMKKKGGRKGRIKKNRRGEFDHSPLYVCLYHFETPSYN